ncbi:MAG: GAF domain-containing protein, partial [Candidatus Methylomirabilales bacterium]
NLQVDERIQLPPEIRRWIAQEGLKAVLAIPLLIKGGEVFGALAVSYKEEREFTDTDVELLSAFGTQVSVAIENARSFDQLALKARLDSDLQAFGRRLLEVTGEEAVLNEAVRVTKDLLEADYVGLFLFDPKGGSLHLEAGVGWEPGNVGVAAVSPAAESLVGHAFLHMETLRVEDVSREGRVQKRSNLCVTHGVQAGLVVPLGVREQPGGVIGTYYRTPHRFTDEEVQAVQSIAHQTALALEKVRLYGELQANLQRLQETQAQLIQADKLKALGTLLSGMAHELNNPLSSILLSVQRQKQQYELPDQARQRLDVIEKQAERASGIIRDLLVFARRKPPERQRVNLNEVVNAALTLQAPDFDLNNIRVVRDLEPALPEIWADKHQLQQVLLNLCTNATHAMKSAHGRGSLSVRSFRKGSAVCVEVNDDGPGIPPDDIGRIFDPFFTTRDAGEGTGLGLSLSFGIVESHGGQMRAENLTGSGARFSFALPVGEGLKPVETPSTEPLVARERARILIVDDEGDLRAILAELISDLGHQAEEAATGQDAISSLNQQDYDLVALDLRLPDLDGREVWRWILSQRPALASRVVFMTGDIMSPETEKFLEEAGRPVLTKPLTTAEITQTVEEVLAQNSSRAS